MKNKFILWIDDMQNWSHIIESNLKILASDNNINLLVLNRLNGEDLEQVFMMHQFDLIVMDYHMEPFNGDKYISQIREEEHLDNIPILFYSQDQNIDLTTLIRNIKNVHVTDRASVEDSIKEFIFPIH
jgi:CheY-like chemotaxis protein